MSQNGATEDRLVSIGTVRHLLGLSSPTVKKLARAGHIKQITLPGGLTRYSLESIRKMVQNGERTDETEND